MFTLKLYQNGVGGTRRSVVMECVGIWSDLCSPMLRTVELAPPADNSLASVSHVTVFKKKVGTDDDDGSFTCYVGGQLPDQLPSDSAIMPGAGGNYYDWGVLENAQGKTTEMFR